MFSLLARIMLLPPYFLQEELQQEVHTIKRVYLFTVGPVNVQLAEPLVLPHSWG